MTDLAERLALADQRHRSQARIAYRVAGKHHTDLMHVHQLGWHYFDGRRWVADDQGVAKRYVLGVLEELWPEAQHDNDLRKDILACQTHAGVTGVLGLCEALEPFAITIGQLDQDPYLLNTPAGTLDLRTYEVRPHDYRDRITKITNGSYRPWDDPNGWQAFIAEVLPADEVRQYLQRVTGVALLGRVVEHVLPILTGTGANGKGTYYETMSHALGDYSLVAEPDLLMPRDGAHPTGQMDLRGARFVVVSETDEGRRLAIATMKRLTGGDTIRARRMRQDFVQFTPSHTPFLITNHLPTINGDDPATWRRIRVVPFDVVIPPERRDPGLGERLKASADEVLTWAVNGWLAYKEAGDKLAEPAAVLARTDAYQMRSDNERRFIAECCVTGGPHITVTYGALYDRYHKWCSEEGVPALGSKPFGQWLDSHGYDTHRGTGGQRVRRGIGLLNEESADDSGK